MPDEATFWVTATLLVMVPLVFSASVFRPYATPKLAVLLVGASLLAGLVALDAACCRARRSSAPARTVFVWPFSHINQKKSRALPAVILPQN